MSESEIVKEVDSKQKPKCECGLCNECLSVVIGEDNLLKLTLGKHSRDKLLAKYKDNEILEQVIWDSWKQTYFWEKLTDVELDKAIIKAEANLRFLSNIVSARKVTKVRSETSPEELKDFKERLKKKRENAGKKVSVHTHSSKEGKTPKEIVPSNKAIYKTDDKKERNLIKAILLLNKQGGTWLNAMIPQMKKDNPEYNIEEICKKIGVKL